jgi:hypothetical protein
MLTGFLLLFTALFSAAAGPPDPTLALPVWFEGGAPPARDRITVRLNGGDPVRVARVLGPKDDLTILIVLDVTGDLALVEPARTALAGQIEALRPNELVAVLRSQDGLKVLADPSADRAAVNTAITGVPVGGYSGMLDTLEAAARVADAMLRKAAVRVAVFYVTDSVVSNYREDFTNPVINSSDARDMSRRFPEGLIRERVSKVEAGLSTLGAPVFFVHLAYHADRLGEAYQAGLLQLASSTGGDGVFCRSVAEVPEAVAKMMESIRGQSLVTVRAPAGLGRRPATVQVESEAKITGFRSRITPAY